MNRTAAFVVNYNMVERTDAICEHLARNVKSPLDIIVIDNGSDLMPLISSLSLYEIILLQTLMQYPIHSMGFVLNSRDI